MSDILTRKELERLAATVKRDTAVGKAISIPADTALWLAEQGGLAAFDSWNCAGCPREADEDCKWACEDAAQALLDWWGDD
jgi:hypothetical protein